MLTYTSISKETKKQGTLFIISNDKERKREDLAEQLINKNVMIDNTIYKVKAVKTKSVTVIGNGEHIGLLV
jgi:hypothetical protein